MFPDDPREVWRGAGVDLDKLGSEPGIAIIPTGSYGARNTTESEQANYDTFLNPASKAIGFGHLRAFAAYMIYHELGERMPYDKLGVKAKGYYYCSAVDAGGRNSLEKFAVVLADQDSSFLRDGGNSYVEGDPAVWRPWFAEFRSLPAKPFMPLESARDPIAVWFADLDGAFYFYAVNRERVPLMIALRIKGSGKTLSLTSGKECPVEKGGALRLTLAPYELRAFKCRGGASVVSSDTLIPRELSDFVKQRLAFAQDLAEQMKAVRRDDVSDAERNAFAETLAVARDACRKKWYWRARTALSMAQMMHAYVKLGVMPAGQIVTRFPDKLEGKPARFYVFGEPLLKAEEIRRMLSPGAATRSC